MGLFNKIKQGLGIGTAKVELDVPNFIPAGTTEISGQLTLAAQSDQKVKSLKVALVEKSNVTVNNETRIQQKDIQWIVMDEPFVIKKGETRVLPFTLCVDRGNKMSFQVFGGTLEISGSSNASVTYEIVATADLEGVALDPTAGKPVTFGN